MTTLREVIEVARPVEHCFRYVADFRTTVEWDATAIRAAKITPGPIAVGSYFSVLCKAGPTSLALDYVVTGMTPFHSIELEGTGRFFTVRDTITFEALASGMTRITYVAQFQYRLGLGVLAQRAETGLRKMGRTSLKGLTRALEDNNPAPTTSADTQKKDASLATALGCFTRYGYHRGRRRWHPLSSDLSGKHVVLTGANSGLGFATAVALIEAGANLTLVIRDPKKVEHMQSALQAETGRRAGRVELADLSLLSEVNALSDRLIDLGEPVDVLINNAGALFNEYAETPEGIEGSVALLLLSPWRLTERLMPLIEHHEIPARVINVVSGGMYTQKLRCDHLIMPPDSYNGSIAYARSKRALTVLTELWADEWQSRNIVVNSMHPGWADTPGVQTALPGFRRITQKVLRTPEEGADTIIWLARAKEADQATGLLFLDREPRTTHLRHKTVENAGERCQLRPWLRQTYDTLKLDSDA